MEAIDRSIIELFNARNPRGLARAISRAEGGHAAPLIHALHTRAGRATTIGLTGPPGVGKSTLASALARVVRARGRSVGVISVDPSSPFSRGAILGDRIRLHEHFVDAGVFIRSMASRGHLGGLAGATADAIMLMDAFGQETIVVETVGVGQSEVEVADLVDTTIVALQPGSGDSVQLLKAGVLEIADIFVLNKADHPGALFFQREIRSMMEAAAPAVWAPRLVVTRASEGEGIDELWEAIEAHGAFLRASGELALRRRRAFSYRVRSIALAALERHVAVETEARVAALGAEALDPYVLAEEIVEALYRAPEAFEQRAGV